MSDSVPAPPGKTIPLSLVTALTSLGILFLIVVLSVVLTGLVFYRKRLTKDSHGIDAYIEIGPLAPTRMDIPEDDDVFGVHKVSMQKDHENGNLEVAK